MNKNWMFCKSLSVLGRLSVGTGALLLLTAMAAFASTPQGTFDRTLQVSGAVNLEVQTHSGDVTIRSGPSGSVVIHGRIYVNNGWFSSNRDEDVRQIEQNPPIRQDGNTIRVDYVSFHNISVNYEITVPVETTVHSQTGSGNQSIEGTRGEVDVTTGSGDVRLANLTGEIHPHTGSGNVRAREISGPVRGGTGSGDIEIEETGSGDVELRTGSGNITVRGIQGSFRGETGSGDVTAEGTQSGTWDIHTGSGNVRVRLPGNAAFDADLSTSSGTVDVDSPVEMTVEGRIGGPHKTIRGKVRGGGPMLIAHTGSGDIHIE